MERKAAVYTNDYLAGYLIQTDKEYIFQYEDEYFNDLNKPAISLTFPKSQKKYHSKHLFPFFFGLLSEGDLKILQCRKLGIALPITKLCSSSTKCNGIFLPNA